MASVGQARLTPEQIRAKFPALAGGFAFLENAGGSQVPDCVINAMTDFMRSSYVQTGAGYAASDRATEVATEAHRVVSLLFNGEGLGYPVLGPSTTALLFMLGTCIGRTLQPGDEVIVSVANHESNIAPWVRLAEKGVSIKWWGVDPETGTSNVSDLAQLITDRTRLIAFAMTSNLVGDIIDPAAVAQLARSVGAAVVVDCVAAASHQALDVAAWGVDFAVLSTYKVYGPHMAGLWGRREAWERLDGPNHFFISAGGSAKFELGCLSYEGCAGIVALAEYLGFLAEESGPLSRPVVESAFATMKAFENPVTDRLLSYFATRNDIRVIGERSRPELRHPTISFVHKTKSSPDIVRDVHRHPIGIRHGHMYAYRLCDALGVPTETGVVRISAVHTNTVDEIDRLARVLDEALA